jgi:hypothetical protein
MGVLRRLFGRDDTRGGALGSGSDAASVDADEQAHELEMLQAEQVRLDELAQRQLRYAHYAWQPPAQGGERRADDGDKPEA